MTRALLPAVAAAVFGLAAAPAVAAEVPAADAARAAEAWIGRGRAMGRLPEGAAVSSVETLVVPGSSARLHVARLEGGGFVVLSADDLVDPVIAFSSTGMGVEADESDPFWALLRRDVAARDAAAGVVRTNAGSGRRSVLRAAGTDAAPTSAQRKWAELLGRPSESPRAVLRTTSGIAEISEIWVEPFVQSQWSQMGDGTVDEYPCYNYYTPNQYSCGCVATMGAQVMRYWRWPQTPVASVSRNCFVDGVETNISLMGGTYDWDSMPLVPANGTTEEQRQAIGRLTHDLSVSMGTKWSVSGSVSDLFELVARFTDTFGYSNALVAVFDDAHPFTLAEFRDIVIPNCDARSPVGLNLPAETTVVEDGRTNVVQTGHTVLVDGYGWSGGDFFVHVNFGLEGRYDGWYCPPDFSSFHPFDAINHMVFNVFPETSGSILSGRVLDDSGAPLAGASVTLSQGAETFWTASDANGIYAVVVPAGDYVVTASLLGQTDGIVVSLDETRGAELSSAETGGWYLPSDGSYQSVGNSWTNDIVLVGLEFAPAPVFSPDSCLFHPSTNVTISCVDEGVAIRYTLDGSTPTANSPLYSGPYSAAGGTVTNGPILVTDTVTIKARSFSPGKLPSRVVTATYTYDLSVDAPEGDYFVDPIRISGTNGTFVIADNSGYTVEAGEPSHTPYEQYRTVWYLWTAPGSGTMTFETSAEDEREYWYSFIAVYTGDAIGSLQQLAYDSDDDDDCIATLSLSVEQGTTYRIVGMTWEDAPCSFTLSWSGDLEVRLSPYEAWAREQSVYPGGPAEKTGGVENAFRYAFGIPSEPFSPILSVSLDASGRPVLTFPPVLNTNGVSLTLLSTTNLTDWSSSAVSERPLVLDGDGTMHTGDSDAVRFYRLKARIDP